ncbi:MAG: replication-associated recombination protein A [Deltaproteobacteria bacterium]|nr:replication-associated recombination protein A [Deltaproteobacteria bacterium]
MKNPTLFPPSGNPATEVRPLADRMRPETLDEVVGQEQVTGDGGVLRKLTAAGRNASMVLWGPPGTGKTTLAHVVARATGARFVPFSAVLGGVPEIRKIVAEAEEHLRRTGRNTVLFVDEIHRFSKSQQDAFLPHVEKGTIVLIGATTENPSFEVNAALLSRMTVVRLMPLSEEAVARLLLRASESPRGLGGQVRIDEDAVRLMASVADGDARRGLNLLEQAAWVAESQGTALTAALVSEVFRKQPLRHDKGGDAHHDVVSAFIKSLRGSDPDAALYWMLRMLEAGEDPLFVVRRMVIFAAEDIGNADPRALQVAVSCLDAVRFVGLPEGRIPMAQAVTYLATAPKSNASYLALHAAVEAVQERGSEPVPMHLRNAPTKLMAEIGAGKGYRYPHDFPCGFVDERYLPDGMDGGYYRPKESGYEKQIRKIMEWREELREEERKGGKEGGKKR